MPVEFNFRETSRRVLTRIQNIPQEINFRRVLWKTGLATLGITGLFARGSHLSANAYESYYAQRAVVADIMEGRGFDPAKDLSALDSGTFKVVVRRPWDITEDKYRFAGIDDKTELADHAF